MGQDNLHVSVCSCYHVSIKFHVEWVTTEDRDTKKLYFYFILVNLSIILISKLKHKDRLLVSLHTFHKILRLSLDNVTRRVKNACISSSIEYPSNMDF